MGKNITEIIHHDRHGRVIERRSFSVPLTDAEGDSTTLAMSQKGVTDIAEELRESMNNEAQARENVENDLTAHKTDSEAHADIRTDISSLSESIGDNASAIGTLQENVSGLQNQIDEIIGASAVVSLAASPTVIHVGKEASVTLTATSNPSASSIHITGNGLDEELGGGTKKSYTHTFTPNASGNLSYNAAFIVAGVTKEVSKAVNAVYPIYYGAGADSSAATNEATPRTSPAGTYTITIGTDGHKVYFLVPSTMSIKTAKMSGFDFPLEQPTNITKDGVAYKCYESSNGYVVGTLEIVLT